MGSIPNSPPDWKGFLDRREAWEYLQDHGWVRDLKYLPGSFLYGGELTECLTNGERIIWPHDPDIILTAAEHRARSLLDIT